MRIKNEMNRENISSLCASELGSWDSYVTVVKAASVLIRIRVKESVTKESTDAWNQVLRKVQAPEIR
jgi:hypothetical protein